ncbi:inositol 2-dehydrogenase [Tetragenococcus halophilus subsp. flandriensis]|uniref:Gfo/Idh/MocA family oxidoreductase n=1 Tax=Tetragenococcus halophilus TaxID=51669 RepID=UPI0023EA35B3|nr:Gfo/Idh/MocA family oxidoreductase [Tetragenococcus halophilus]GMA08745.1 inositol 2-dehydrogenase [Tetragenococcus halophilus subsp. flandriensis]
MVNICLIGTGRAGMIHGRNMVKKIKYAELSALCDPMEENLQNAQAELAVKYTYQDYQEALANDEIDAVIIVTPTAYHKEIAIAAAKAKKHILCEKPLAMDEQECKEIISEAQKNNVKLQVGFMRRFDVSFQEAKKVIDSGEIGDVVLVKSLTHGPSKPKEWMYDISLSSGPIGEVNSHDLDTLRWFANDEVASIYAIGGNFRSPEMGGQYPDYYDTVSMNLKFKNGILGAIDGAQYVQYGYDARAEILGTNGSILIGDQGKNNLFVANKNHQITHSTMNSWTYLFREAYVKEDQAFVDCIMEDTMPLVTGYDGLMAVKLVHTGLTSLLNNKIEYL